VPVYLRALPYTGYKHRTQFSETARNIKRRLRVKNAGCNEDFAVESAEF